MPITSSQIIRQSTQTDGRSYVTERHTDHRGENYDIEYLAAVGMDINQVLLARAANIGAEIDAREAVSAAAQGYEIPLSPTQFLALLTLEERIAIRDAAVSNKALADYLDYLAKTQAVYRKAPLGQTTINGLNYLEGIGLLAAGRATTILSA